MRYLKILEDHSGVVQAYLRCQEAMREGFDSEVGPETRKLAETLLGRPVDSVLHRHALARGTSNVRGTPMTATRFARHG
jgi:hypothetical protein